MFGDSQEFSALFPSRLKPVAKPYKSCNPQGYCMKGMC